MCPNAKITQLIDKIINHWSQWELNRDYYIQTLVPKLIENPDFGDDFEKELFS